MDVFINTSGYATVWWNGAAKITGTIPINNNAWHYIALVRDSSNNVKLYVDGNQDGSTVVESSNFLTTSNGITIGTYATRDGQGDWNGYIDEVRISRDIARWTSNFTPPTSAYESYAQPYAKTYTTITSTDQLDVSAW